MPTALRRLLPALIALAVLPSIAVAQAAAAKVDLTGKWAFSVTTSGGTGTPTVTLKQQGDSISGRYSSQVLGEAELKGTVNDNKITFSFRTQVQGSDIAVTYTGTVEDKDTLKGAVDLGGAASGTFSAKRQP